MSENTKEWRFPASFGQERIWLTNQLDPTSAVYNLPCQIRQDQPLSAEQWRRALGLVVDRHEILRACLVLDGDALVQVVRADVPIEPEVHDLRALPENEREQRAAELALAVARRPIPTDAAPLWRALLCRLAEDEWVLTFVVHHAVFDATSVVVFARDLNEACDAVHQGREPRWTELAIQYPDYAAWQRGQVEAGALAQQLDYWRAHLAGMPAVHTVPTDRPRPAEVTFDGDQVDFVLPEGLLERATDVGGRLSATPFLVLFAGYVALLSRISRADEVVVGVPVAGRDLPELAPLVGMFVNQLAIRVDCGGDPTFADLVGRARTVLLDAMDNGQAPFQLVAQTVVTERDAGVQPLYQLGFNFIPDSGLEPIPYATAQDDLTVDLTRDRGRLLYRTDLFDRATAESLVQRYLRVLAAALDDPRLALSDLPLLSESERERVLHTWNDTAAPYPDTATVHGLVEQRARSTPDAVAVELGGRKLTYVELNAAANRVAHRLRGLGAAPGTVVGVCAPNSADLLVGLLGVLKSGAAYVPLDPDHPAERKALIAADAAVGAVLTSGTVELPPAWAASDPAEQGGPTVLALDDPGQWAELPEHDPLPTARAGDLAYVLYTSGSTGRPKGVQVEHRAVVAYLSWACRQYPGLSGRALLHTSASFDLTVTTLFGPLLAGGTIVDAAAGRPTFVKATPTHLALLSEEEFPSGDLVLGGETLTGDAVTAWRQRYPDTTITNEYGPTEATVGCVAARFTPGEPLPPGPVSIGRPMPNVRAYVLDERLRPVPPGVVGLLYVAGPQLARGYLGRPELTAERFPELEVAGGRVYATGDLARWRIDGTLDYLGRGDDQIALRGYRIEPGEVEAALRTLPGVREAAVAVRDGNLVGYLVGPPAADPDGVAAWSSALRKVLPDYLVPTGYVVLDALPVAPSGKLDRAALPTPERGSGQPFVAPRTAAEELVAELFTDVLGADRVGAHDDFFALGGNSLSAMRLLARLMRQTAVELGVRELFSLSTVAGLAAEVEQRMLAALDELSDEEVQRLLAEEQGNERA